MVRCGVSAVSVRTPITGSRVARHEAAVSRRRSSGRTESRRISGPQARPVSVGGLRVACCTPSLRDASQAFVVRRGGHWGGLVTACAAVNSRERGHDAARGGSGAQHHHHDTKHFQRRERLASCAAYGGECSATCALQPLHARCSIGWCALPHLTFTLQPALRAAAGFRSPASRLQPKTSNHAAPSHPCQVSCARPASTPNSGADGRRGGGRRRGARVWCGLRSRRTSWFSERNKKSKRWVPTVFEAMHAIVANDNRCHATTSR